MGICNKSEKKKKYKISLNNLLILPIATTILSHLLKILWTYQLLSFTTDQVIIEIESQRIKIYVYLYSGWIFCLGTVWVDNQIQICIFILPCYHPAPKK